MLGTSGAVAAADGPFGGSIITSPDCETPTRQPSRVDVRGVAGAGVATRGVTAVIFSPSSIV